MKPGPQDSGQSTVQPGSDGGPSTQSGADGPVYEYFPEGVTVGEITFLFTAFFVVVSV